MSDTKTEEPSIEDILGSIRRIIADEPSAADTQPLEADPSDDHFDADDDVLELVDPITQPAIAEEVAPTPMTDQNDIDSMFDTPTPAAAPAEDISFDAPAPTPAVQTESLVSATAAAATAAVMSKLASRTAINQVGHDGITIEDVVRELLRPMLQGWLDENLPTLVQNMVERELDRITRQVR